MKACILKSESKETKFIKIKIRGLNSKNTKNIETLNLF